MTHGELKIHLDLMGCNSAEILEGVEPDDQAGIDAIAFFATRIVTGVEIIS